MIEQGKRGLSAPALKKATHLLQVDMDDLISHYRKLNG